MLIDVANTAVVLPSSTEYPIAAIGWDEHGLAVAVRTKGIPTVEPLAGLVTTIPDWAVANADAIEATSAKTMAERAFTFT